MCIFLFGDLHLYSHSISFSSETNPSPRSGTWTHPFSLLCSSKSLAFYIQKMPFRFESKVWHLYSYIPLFLFIPIIPFPIIPFPFIRMLWEVQVLFILDYLSLNIKIIFFQKKKKFFSNSFNLVVLSSFLLCMSYYVYMYVFYFELMFEYFNDVLWGYILTQYISIYLFCHLTFYRI